MANPGAVGASIVILVVGIPSQFEETWNATGCRILSQLQDWNGLQWWRALFFQWWRWYPTAWYCPHHNILQTLPANLWKTEDRFIFLIICLHLECGLFGMHTLQSVFDLGSFVELYISLEIVLGLTPNNAATCSGKQQLQSVLQHGSYPDWKNVAY